MGYHDMVYGEPNGPQKDYTNKELLDKKEDQLRDLEREIHDLRIKIKKEDIKTADIGEIWEIADIDNLYHVHVDEGSEGFDFILVSSSEERVKQVVDTWIERQGYNDTMEDGYDLNISELGRYGMSYLWDVDTMNTIPEESNVLMVDKNKSLSFMLFMQNMVKELPKSDQ